MEYEFSSIQIDFTPEASSYFQKKIKGLIKPSSLYKSDSGMGLNNDPHVTILYGLHDVHPPLCAIDIIETHPKFNITLGSISLFKGEESGEPFDVVKTNIESSDVYALNAALSDACEYTSDFPEYIPHATIAYVQKDTCDHLDGSRTLFGLSFLVDHLIYSSKSGIHRFLFLGRK